MVKESAGYPVVILMSTNFCNEDLPSEVLCLQADLNSSRYLMCLSNIALDPVIQSIISLMKPLMVDVFSFKEVMKLIGVILFAEKLCGSFAMQKSFKIFQQKKWQ